VETKTKKRVTVVLSIIMIWLSMSLLATPFPPKAEAKYGHREKTDSWGDSIQIVSNYNIAGGHVDYKAVAGKVGIRVSTYGIGYTVGYYRARIIKFYVYLKCYDSAGNVIKSYRKTYYPNKGSYRKTVSVPSGTVKCYSKISVKFQLLYFRLGYPTKTLSLSLYS